MKNLTGYILGPASCLILAIFKVEGWAVLSWAMVLLPIWLPGGLLLISLLFLKK